MALLCTIILASKRQAWCTNACLTPEQVLQASENAEARL
jgi:hypothetical protein